MCACQVWVCACLCVHFLSFYWSFWNVAVFVGRLIDLFAKDLLKSAQWLCSPYVPKSPFVPVWLRKSVVLLLPNMFVFLQTGQGVALSHWPSARVGLRLSLRWNNVIIWHFALVGREEKDFEEYIFNIANYEKLYPSFDRTASFLVPLLQQLHISFRGMKWTI